MPYPYLANAEKVPGLVQDWKPLLISGISINVEL
jgi:hypothetical protein